MQLLKANRAITRFVAFIVLHDSQALLVDSLLVHICGRCALVAFWPWLNLCGVFVVLDAGWFCETEKHVS